MMVDYNTLATTIQPGMVIKFREYNLDRHERKKLSIEIDGAVIQEVIPAGQSISIDLLKRYYGEDLDDITYRQLSSVNCLRIVLIVGNTEDVQPKPIYKIILLNQDFYTLGLQEVEIITTVNRDEPNYTSQMGMYNSGINVYDS